MLYLNGKPHTIKLDTLKKSVTFVLSDVYGRRETVGNSYGETYNRNKSANIATFDAFYNYSDPTTNQNVELRYAERVQPKTTPTGAVNYYAPRKIVFKRGILVVKPGQSDLLFFLMNSPHFEKEDGSNSSTAKFRILDSGKHAQKIVEFKSIKLKAEELIIGESKAALSETALRRLLGSYEGFSGDAETMAISEVKAALLSFAEMDPEKLYKAAHSKKTGVKVVINENLSNEKISWDDASRSWKWAKNKKGEAKVIVVVPQGRDKTDWFVEWLTEEDNSNVLEELNTFSELIREEKDMAALK
jgi:hypothetical protein